MSIAIVLTSAALFVFGKAVFAVRYCDWQRVVFIVRGVYVSIVLYLKVWLYHNGSDHLALLYYLL
ncbi:hypothetical protein BSAF29S_00973 [Bacillus safensis subsp. safensis]